jgi:hypothetical protein
MHRTARQVIVLTVLALVLGGCGDKRATGGSSGAAGATTALSRGFARVRVRVPAGNGGGVFSEPRTMTLPRGWSAEV